MIVTDLEKTDRSYNRPRILISLYKGYGLGDGVQMSAVLRHVAKYRPDWVVDYQADEGKHVVGRGIVENVFAYGEPYPSRHYDAEVQICLYDTWANWGDRPNTRVSSALHERFGLPWDAECGRYRVDVSADAMEAARTLLYNAKQSNQARKTERQSHKRLDGRKSIRYVAVHYQGDSSQPRKNLMHSQADEVCREIERLGRTPLILDWRNRSDLDYAMLRTPERWGGNAEMVCAVIRHCEAFVGIDSGPSKCASSTDTPSLVTWTGHHPAPFHDPAPNTTHLVPEGYHGLHPVCNDSGVIKWFEANYNVRQYGRCPVPEIKKWLQEVLK